MKKVFILILLLLLSVPGYCATPDLVPRVDGEGSIGDAVKAWGNGYFDALNVNGVPVGGGGSTTKCLQINPGSMEISGTMALTGDATVGATVDSSNGSVLLFSNSTGATDSGAAKRVRLPSNWASHGTVRLTYSMTTGTSNEVEWEAGIMCQSGGDSQRDDADSFAAMATTVGTVPATVRYPAAINITPTDDTCAADDLMTINISTDADDATNDDATGIRRLIGLEYCYTES